LYHDRCVTITLEFIIWRAVQKGTISKQKLLICLKNCCGVQMDGAAVMCEYCQKCGS
jgi:hypothetical protein